MNKLYICDSEYKFSNRYLLTLTNLNHLVIFADDFTLDDEKDLLSFYKAPCGNDIDKELIATFNWRYIIGLCAGPNVEVEYD